jgi:hypothetical protein
MIDTQFTPGIQTMLKFYKIFVGKNDCREIMELLERAKTRKNWTILTGFTVNFEGRILFTSTDATMESTIQNYLDTITLHKCSVMRILSN